MTTQEHWQQICFESCSANDVFFCRGVSQIACWSEANSNQRTEKLENIFAKTTFMEESNMQLDSLNYNHSCNTEPWKMSLLKEWGFLLEHLEIYLKMCASGGNLQYGKSFFWSLLSSVWLSVPLSFAPIILTSILRSPFQQWELNHREFVSTVG